MGRMNEPDSRLSAPAGTGFSPPPLQEKLPLGKPSAISHPLEQAVALTQAHSVSEAEWRARQQAAESGLHAVIDLDRLITNLRLLQLLLPSDVEILAMLKANAYGHGLLPIAWAALWGGARWLGVARIEEGLLLREGGITAPILVLGPPNPERLEGAIRAGLHLAVGSAHDVAALRAAAERLGLAVRVHLEVDTGMHRFGADPDEVVGLAQELVTHPLLEFEGLYTHFATADAPDGRILELQEERFRTVRQQLLARGLHPPVVHQANSAAALRGAIGDPVLPGRRVVRLGMAFYGFPPNPAMTLPPGIRPALELRSRLVRCFVVHPGEGISYGHTYKTNAFEHCGVVPIGYGDGLPLLLSNRGWFQVRGQRCPIRGRICMDQTIISLASCPQAEVGDLVVIFGSSDQEAMTPWDAATLTGTIAYELLTHLAPRIPRLYHQAGRFVAIADLTGLCWRPPVFSQ